MRQTVALLDVLIDLCEEESTTLAASSTRRSLAAHSADAITAVVGYLEGNFRRPVRREEVAAAAVSLSPSSVSRLLRSHLGTTMTDYVLNLRLDAACRELVETNKLIATIAHDCGFSNLANFNRQFRQKRSLTPRDYHHAFRPL